MPRFIPSQRQLFDIPDDITYFNCAYYSPQLKETAKRLHEGVDEKSHPWNRKSSDFFHDAETIRKLASELFGGDSDGFAIVPSVSYGMSSAIRAIEKKISKGDVILLLAEEFPSVVLPCRRLSAETGATIKTLDYPLDGNWTQQIIENITKEVRLLAISSCHWTNGAFIDLKKVGETCKNHDTLLIIDTTQTLGAVPLNLNDVEPDFLVTAGYKWLLTPYGFGLIYVDKKWRSERPLEESWLNRENAEDFAGLVNYNENYKPGARRYEMGEKGIPTILPGAIAALEQLKEWGIDNIAFTLNEINKRIGEFLVQKGFILMEEQNRNPHILGAKIPDSFSSDLVGALRNKNIYISQRGNSIRFAPHLYVNETDILKLFNTLKTLL